MSSEPSLLVSDEALLAQYAAGDARASAELARRLLPKLLNHARRMLGDAAEAEDVAQEAMLRLWRLAPDWRQGDAKVSTWVYRVTANLCIDRMRKHRDAQLQEGFEPVDGDATADQKLLQQHRLGALQTALNRLPNRQRQAVVLRHIDGLSNPEIAQIMNLSTRAVESLTARAKRGLAAELHAQQPELGYTDE